MDQPTSFDRALAWKNTTISGTGGSKRAINLTLITVGIIIIVVLIAVWYALSLRRGGKIVEGLKGSQVETSKGTKKYKPVGKAEMVDVSFTDDLSLSTPHAGSS